MRHGRLFIFTSALALGLAGCAGGWPTGDIGDDVDNEEVGFNDVDQDESGLIDASEWATGVNTRDMFYDLDENEDTFLDNDEYSAGGFEQDFDTVDADDDDLIGESEFGQGLFDDWDSNDDQAVDQAEWDAGESGIFDV